MPSHSHVLNHQTYINWIIGSWVLSKPDPACRAQNPLVRIVMGQLLADTSFYCICTVAFATVMIANRCCPNKLLPGFAVDSGNWPWGCPRITVDRSLWRRRGETRQEYQARMEALHHVQAVQPRPLQGMTTEEGVRLEVLGGLSREEVDSLPTVIIPGPQSLSDSEEDPVDVRVISNEASTPSSDPPLPTDPTALYEAATHPLAIPDTTLPSPPPPPLPSTWSSSPTSIPPDPAPTTSTTCALCLSDYEPGERLRELPCNHRFHDVCIDPWLMSRRTCPVCSRVVVVDER